jgi:hypothetical protein
LAPSLLRVQALLELPIVLLAYVAAVRRLDTGLYLRLARPPLLWAAALVYSAVFCSVEWDLHNPWTVQDIWIRAGSALLTPLWVAALARRDGRRLTPRQVESSSGLLLYAVWAAALGALVLVVYDTALLYNLRLLARDAPVATLALVLLAAAGRLLDRNSQEPGRALRGGATRAAAAGLRWALALFFVPALAVRYGETFGTPLLAQGAGAAVLLAASVLAVCETAAGRPAALLARLAAAAAAGLTAAYLVRLAAPTAGYYEVGLLEEAAAFLAAALGVCATADRGRGMRRGRVDRNGHHGPPGQRQVR